MFMFMFLMAGLPTFCAAVPMTRSPLDRAKGLGEPVCRVLMGELTALRMACKGSRGNAMGYR